MSDLVAFLRARLDEDEQTEHLDRISAEDRAALLADFDVGESPEYALMEVGFGRWMAEVQAKRAILDLHAPLEDAGWVTCAECFDPHGTQCPEYPCETVRHLMSVYADHPDYDESWRP